jgi:predicted kinase
MANPKTGRLELTILVGRQTNKEVVRNMKLIIFSGLPGTGKTTLAETVGKHYSIPVFAKDWLEATLLRSELVPSNGDQPLGSAGYRLLTMLAERQLMLNQSAILDSVASTQSIRNTWKRLAHHHRAEWRVIECKCSDESYHRAHLVRRERNIPGWHELQWADVEYVRGYFAPWAEHRLILDMVDSFDENLGKAMVYCG